MRIHVEEVNLLPDSLQLVRFQCQSGETWGNWSNHQLVPRRSQDYSVELDVDQVMTLGQNASYSRQSECAVNHEEGLVTLNGLVEDRDDDGMIYLRIAPDCLMMIESEGAEIQKGKWLQVRLEPSFLRISAQ